MNNKAEMIAEFATATAGRKVTVEATVKNNDTPVLMFVMEKSPELSMRIEATAFVEAYENGVFLPLVVDKLVDIFTTENPDGKKLADDMLTLFTDWEKARKYVFYTLVDSKKNKKMLSEIPNKSVEQLPGIQMIYHLDIDDIFPAEPYNWKTVIITTLGRVR